MPDHEFDCNRPPPEVGEGRPQREPADTEQVATTTTDTEAHQPQRHTHYTASGRRGGSHAATFRWGFSCGFRDALRLAQREIDDPHVWLVLSRLADRYEGPDSYALAGSDG